MMLGMTGSWPNPDALWYEFDGGIARWDFRLDAWTFFAWREACGRSAKN